MIRRWRAAAVAAAALAVLGAASREVEAAPAVAAAPACPPERRVLVVVTRDDGPVDPEILGEIALAVADTGIRATSGDVPAEETDPACVAHLRVTARGEGAARHLHVALVRPGSPVLLVREESDVAAGALLARSVVLARDLLAAADSLPRSPAPAVVAAPPAALPEPSTTADDEASDGTLALALGGASLGAFTGLGVHLATGADDPRILYPMLAVGAGVGLGGALLIAGEWQVTDADAWMVIAGGVWPTAAAHLIYEGRFAEQRDDEADEERWTYGLVGTTAGLGLTTLSLALRRPTAGDAALVHSGAAYGAALGGLVEYGVDGAIDGIPEAGLGYGAAIGWLAAGTVSIHVDVAPGDVLAVDLGAALGGLGGAALASPLVFDHPDTGAQRAFLGIAAGSTLVGAGIGWWLRPERSEPKPPTPRRGLGSGVPGFGVLGESVVGSRRAPIVGASYSAVLR